MTPPAWNPRTARRIVVLRAGGLGDLVFALPALGALRRAAPDAEIILLGERWQDELLSGRPSPIDRVEILSPTARTYLATGRLDDPADLDRTLGPLRKPRPDLAVQIHGGGRTSNPLISRLDAALTIGLRTADAQALDRWVPYVYYQHEVLRALEVVGLVGARATEIEPRLALVDADFEEADRSLGDRSRIAVIHPGATDPRRRWPTDRFASVGDELAAAGATVAVIGSAAEADLVDAVGRAMSGPAILLAGRLSMGGLVGTLARASVVVANDSGPLHLAAAVGAPTVGVYWCGNLINAGPFTRTDHRAHLSWRLACPECGVDCTRDRCSHASSFVAEVGVAEVVEDAIELLGELRGRRP
jgi:ADP-heptose:LPS heptosyltransferase